MKEEVKSWWDQAQADLRVAEALMGAREYHAVVFHVHQALEKGLKALALKKTKNPQGEEMTSHSLSFLGRRLKAPKDVHQILQDLSPEYVISHYPMPGQEPPERLYGEEKARQVLGHGKDVFAWIERQLK